MLPSRSSAGPLVVWTALVLGLLLSGCATPQPTGSQDKVPPPVQVEATAQGPTVVRLEAQGGQGFIIREVAAMDPAARMAFDQAVLFIGEEQFDAAIDVLEPLTTQTPGITAPHINLAIAYQGIGETEKAKSALQAALAIIPDHPVACNAYALICRKNGAFDEARVYYEKAITAFPDYYPVHRNLGILLDLYLNDPGEALAHYEAYSAARPEDEKVKLWIADLQGRLGSQ